MTTPMRIIGATLALIACGAIASCGSDTDEKPKPSTESSEPSASESAIVSGTTEPTLSRSESAPLGGDELVVFDRVVPGAEERDLYVVGLDGGEPTLLHSPGGLPRWSPDASELAFGACLDPPQCTTGLTLLDRSTGDVRGFPTPDPALEINCGQAWSPDGKRLACEVYGIDDSNRNGIYTIRAADGEGLKRITTSPNGDDFPLAYSPDGSRLLLTRTDPSRDESANQALFVTPTSGDRPQRITPWGFADDLASWSPDGRTIVFGHNGALERVSPTGQGLRRIRLTMPDGSSALTAYDVSFSPDGQRIVFSLGSPKPGIYTSLLDGRDVKQLTNSPTEDHHASWGAESGS